jgi:hypothetical protein
MSRPKPPQVLAMSASLALLTSVAGAQIAIEAPHYNSEGELLYPEDTDMWVHMGSSLGSDYSEGPFDPDNPGTLGVVQIEPSAYRYFMENNEYADGTMFLLSFYASESESSPQLSGFVQGRLNAKEIHVIDSARFEEGRGFFLYEAEDIAGDASPKLPNGSTCVVCHMAEGDYNGTFTQFYPPIRDNVPAG